MKQNIMQQGVRLLIASGLMLALMLTGCEKDKSGPVAQTITGPENTKMNASVKSSSGNYCYYTPKGSRLSLQDTPNCHSYAWQNSSMPGSVPSYGIYDPTPFWQDGSYIEVTGQKIKEGDRANYGGSYHSAVVCGVDNNGTVLVNSYWVGKGMEYSVPATKYGNPRYYRIADIKYWNTPNCPRWKIALKSCLNGRYVCADFWNNTNSVTWNPDAPLWSNRDWVREWETFYLIDAGGGKVYLWSYATFAYVNASLTGRAIANGGYSGPGAKFTLEYNSSFQHWAFKSDLNNYYLRSDSFQPKNIQQGTGAYFDLTNL